MESAKNLKIATILSLRIEGMEIYIQYSLITCIYKGNRYYFNLDKISNTTPTEDLLELLGVENDESDAVFM